MPMAILYLGPAPPQEVSQGLLAEVLAWKDQVRRRFGAEPSGCFLATEKASGLYHLSLHYNNCVSDHLDYSLSCQHALPKHWDYLARKSLGHLKIEQPPSLDLATP